MYSVSFIERKVTSSKTPMFVNTKLNCQKNAYMSQHDPMIQSLVYNHTDILRQGDQRNQQSNQ